MNTNRWVVGTICLAAAASLAEPRVAVHPLDIGSVTSPQRERLRAQFDVMLAKTSSVRFAGSSRLDEAMGKSAAAGCEVRDSCLRFLAESTESLYGVYIRADVQPDQVVTNARVVRIDGLVVRRSSIALPLPGAKQTVETVRQALAKTLADLKLGELASTMPDEARVAAELPAPPSVPAPEPTASNAGPFQPPVATFREPSSPGRRSLGLTLVATGGAAMVVGGIFAGLAASGMSSNPPDAAGLVAPERAGGVSDALRNSQVGAVLIPVGAAVAIAGALVAFLPGRSSSPVALSAAPARDGVRISLSGTLP